MIPRDEVLQRDGNGLVKAAGFREAEHGALRGKDRLGRCAVYRLPSPHALPCATGWGIIGTGFIAQFNRSRYDRRTCPATGASFRRRIGFDRHSSRRSSVARSRFTSDDAKADVATVAARTEPTTVLNEPSGTEYGGLRINRGRSTLMK